jgi:beta-xylosidase
MESIISYKNRLIRGESFQLPQSTSWIPRYALVREAKENEWNTSLTHHDRLDKVFWSKSEADEFALSEAKRRIDQLSGIGIR